MRITGFKVDKTQPANTMKVGNNWRHDNERTYSLVKPRDYIWDHNEFNTDVPRPVPSFQVVKIGGGIDGTMKVAFWVEKNAAEELGTFSASVKYGTATIAVSTQPEFEDGASNGKPGVITITPADDQDSEFILKYTAKGEEEAKEVFYIHELVAKDWMHAPVVGEYKRKDGRLELVSE